MESAIWHTWSHVGFNIFRNTQNSSNRIKPSHHKTTRRFEYDVLYPYSVRMNGYDSKSACKHLSGNNRRRRSSASGTHLRAVPHAWHTDTGAVQRFRSTSTSIGEPYGLSRVWNDPPATNDSFVAGDGGTEFLAGTLKPGIIRPWTGPFAVARAWDDFPLGTLEPGKVPLWNGRHILIWSGLLTVIGVSRPWAKVDPEFSLKSGWGCPTLTSIVDWDRFVQLQLL